MFEDVQISFSDMEQSLRQPQEPEKAIQAEAETVDDDEFTAPSAAAAAKTAYTPWLGETEKNIEIYDPEELEAQLPAELNYCTVLQNPDDKSRDAAWVERCGTQYPASSEELLAAVRACIAGKESVIDSPMVVLMNKS